MNPRLAIEQKFTLFVNRYLIYRTNEQGEHTELAAFVEQKRFAIKEKILFYADRQKTQLLFSMRAEKVMDVHGRYFVEDANGRLLGALRKDFRKSFLNSTWQILDDGKPVFTIRENSRVLAFIRRIAQFLPVVGDLAELVVAFFRYHFVFVDQNGVEVGRHTKVTLWRDHYVLSMTDTAYKSLDWRVFAAISVALDALQSR